MELYIARHGETEYNLARRFQGSGVDSPLTDNGITQAKTLGKAICSINFDAIFSSPLKRAMDTARFAFSDDDLFENQAFTDKRLVEIGLGEAEGKTWEEVGLSTMLDDPEKYIPPSGGESIKNMIVRVDSFLEELAEHSYKKIFVLTHGYVLRVIYACAMDKSVAAVGQAPFYDNCSLVRYKRNNNRWESIN